MTDSTVLACRAALLTRWLNAGLVREWLGRADMDERTAALLDDAAACMAEREAKLTEEVERLRVQLAGCGVAALGGTSPAQTVEQGDYGWSASYQDVLNLRRKYDRLCGGIEHACSELGVPQPGYPAPVAEAVLQLRAALAAAQKGTE